MEKINKASIPPFVTHVTSRLQKAGFEAYLVGGCVRDLILGNTPKDWDITTSAHPEQIQKIFSDVKTVYENTFGWDPLESTCRHASLSIL